MSAAYPPNPPPPPPWQVMPLGYMPEDPQARRDGEHLKLLSLFHYIYGGLTMAVSCIFIVYIVIGVFALSNPQAFNRPTPPPVAGTTTRPATAAPPPPVRPDLMFGWVFIGIGSVALLLGWTTGILSIVSGRSIKRRRRHMFSLVIAGICCLNMPLGTALGVFTFIVLLRESVKAQYNRAR